MRIVVLVMGLFCAAALGAQFTAPALEVLAIAPQLEAFAGSPANFESLASGLRSARTVSLTTITPDGMRTVVRFTPAYPLSAVETARLLEAARRRLDSHGVAPGGWEIGITLMGGALLTPSGVVTQAPLIAAADPAKPLVLTLHSFVGSAANYKSLINGLTQGTAVTLRVPGDSRARIRFTPTGGPLSEEQAKYALLLASELLSAFGIEDPAPEDVRAALVGGSVSGLAGHKGLLRGVLDNRGSLK